MFTKIFIISVMVVIIAALVAGLIFLVGDGGKTKRTVGALTLRIGLSFSLFLFLFLAYHFHWLTPHGV